jgi:hypothetical protein
VRACVRACVRAGVRACVRAGGAGGRAGAVSLLPSPHAPNTPAGAQVGAISTDTRRFQRAALLSYIVSALCAFSLDAYRYAETSAQLRALRSAAGAADAADEQAREQPATRSAGRGGLD